MSERYVGVLSAGEDVIRPGWTAVVSRESVAITFPVRHWERIAALPAVVGGKTRVELEIDRIADVVREGLHRQVIGGPAARMS